MSKTNKPKSTPIERKGLNPTPPPPKKPGPGATGHNPTPPPKK